MPAALTLQRTPARWQAAGSAAITATCSGDDPERGGIIQALPRCRAQSAPGPEPQTDLTAQRHHG
jgi:hypothetical protein